MTALIFRPPVCARDGCGHEYQDHIAGEDLDRAREQGGCTQPDCPCMGWVMP